MEDDAIQTDVSTQHQPQHGAGEEVLSARDLAMQEIDNQLESQRVDQVVVVSVKGQMEESASAPSETPALPEILSDEHLDKVKAKVKLDGQEVELPLSEVIKGYQKDAVASRRLAEAAEERRRLEALQREVEAERERQKAAKGAQTPSPKTDPVEAGGDDGDVDAQIKAAMSALVDGDEETATKALKSLLKGRRDEGHPQTTPQIDEEAIIAKAQERTREALAQERAQEDNQKAWQEFVGSNEAFADDQSKERQYGDYLFNTKYIPMLQAGEISYREALSKTAEEVNAVFRPAPSESSSTSTRQQKEERKKAIDNLPVAGARAVRQAPKEETADDVLTEMRQARGQAV